MLESSKDKAPQPGLATQVRSVIGRWTTILNTRPRNGIRQTPPKGKLGEIIRCLEASEAVSLHDLTTLTGWKRATVHSALSRLRAQGHPIKMRKENGAPTYRLEVK